MISPSVHCTFGVKSPVMSSVIATMSAGRPPRSVETNTRVSCDIRRFFGVAMGSVQNGRKLEPAAQRKIIGPLGPIGLIGPMMGPGIAGGPLDRLGVLSLSNGETGDHPTGHTAPAGGRTRCGSGRVPRRLCGR